MNKRIIPWDANCSVSQFRGTDALNSIMSTKLEQLVCVNRDMCDRVASFLGSKEIPLDQEESSLPGFSPPYIGNFYLSLVAICHQTSPRGQLPLEGVVAGVPRRGWDYLFGRLEDAARRDETLLKPERWSRISTNEVRALFCDSVLGERLTNPELRAELLQDLGRGLVSRGWEWADQIHDYCQGRVAEGNPNLLDTLSEFRAYNDPVRKKSLFFLSLMRNSGLWLFMDNESLGPPVDYHEVRGHLRLGTVEISNPSLLRKLRAGVPVNATEDVAIRKSVYDAILLISEKSGLRNPSQLHYLFWNIFRSICTREEPQCFALRPDCGLPDRYMHLTVSSEGNRCPFATVCMSAGEENPICEHIFETDYY